MSDRHQIRLTKRSYDLVKKVRDNFKLGKVSISMVANAMIEQAGESALKNTK